MKIRLKKILKIILYFFLSLLLMHTILITIDGLNDENNPADVGVVFGNEVSPTGELSARLKSRLDKTIELYKDKKFPLIIVSGGMDKYKNNEAQVMKAYLIENSIPESSIITDSKGENTAQTVSNTVKIMNAYQIDSVFAISQFYHIARIKLTFSKLHINKVSSAHADYYELRDLYSLIREFFAYYKYSLSFDYAL